MRSVSVDHYENFPVASVLCPPALRPAVVAIYHFARTADDIADEGDAAAAERLATLAAYRGELVVTSTTGRAPTLSRWPQVFGPLATVLQRFKLPTGLLHDLLSAFEQDTRKAVYASRAEVLDYCRLSANPVGRLLLHLYRVDDAASLARSDAICSALQLINFWQDLSVDTARGRLYLPVEDLARHGIAPAAFLRREDGPAARSAIADVVAWSRQLMHDGAPLVHALPGRAGWELRLVVQGGLRILDHIEGRGLTGGGFDTLLRRPKLRGLDLPVMLARASFMRRRRDSARAASPA